MKKIYASQQIAAACGKSAYWGRCLIRWAKEWKDDKKIILSRRGKHAKVKNLLTDNDVYHLISLYLLEHKYEVTPRLLQKYVNECVLPKVEHSIGAKKAKKGISESTAYRWLRALGWLPSEHKKGLFFDGHEREDVVEYRKVFLQLMKEYETRMIRRKELEPTTSSHITKGPDFSRFQIHILSGNQRPLVFYTHDETVFYANDGQKIIWHIKGEIPLRKKGRGRSIMVSDFVGYQCVILVA